MNSSVFRATINSFWNLDNREYDISHKRTQKFIIKSWKYVNSVNSFVFNIKIYKTTNYDNNMILLLIDEKSEYKIKSLHGLRLHVLTTKMRLLKIILKYLYFLFYIS